MTEKKGFFRSDIFRLFLSLLLISAIVSLLLAGVNMLTEEKIAALEGEAELQTVRQFYDYDAVFVRAETEDGTPYFMACRPAETEEPQSSADSGESSASGESGASGESASSESASGESSVSEAPEADVPASSAPQEAEDAGEYSAAEAEPGEPIGYAVTVSENGYGGEIKMLVAFDLYGNVNGIGVISMSETSGVGTRITGEGFFDQFTGKTGPFKFVKGTASSKNDIVAINGASISSKAAVGAVNKAYGLLGELFEAE